MRCITVDCAGISSREDLHRALSEAMAFPSWYGRNLDALHDCLTGIPEETALTLLHWEALEAALGTYASRVRKVIHHASSVTPSFSVCFVSEDPIA